MPPYIRSPIIKTHRTPVCGVCGGPLKTVVMRKDGDTKIELVCMDYSCDSMKHISAEDINDSRLKKACGRYAILINNTKDKKS